MYGNYKIIETIHNKALRIATGCFKSTLLIVLQTPTNTMAPRQIIKQQECIQMAKNLQIQDTIKQLITNLI